MLAASASPATAATPNATNAALFTAPGVAVGVGQPVWWRGVLALVVSLALQVGVNYANDYSDGVRGTDAERVGPMRLVGSGVASPAAVKRAAFLAFGVAAVAGLVLAASTAWWLVLVGAVSVGAAWFYTGGSKPYGYLGLGEVMVFLFFGLVAVLGTQYVQAEEITAAGWYAACGIGALACAILVANNLRDIPTDRDAGKMTLAVRLGDRQTRALFAILVAAALVALVRVAIETTWWALLALVFLVPAGRAVAVVRRSTGRDLVPALQLTGVAELAYGLGLFVGLLVGAT